MSRTLGDILRVPCRPTSIGEIRRAIRELAGRDGFESPAADDLILAVSEAVTNAVRYGCPAGGDVEVRWTRDGERAEVEIIDTGVFRSQIPPEDLDESRGRGLPLMIALVDEMHLRRGTLQSPGTVVRLVKFAEP